MKKIMFIVCLFGCLSLFAVEYGNELSFLADDEWEGASTGSGILFSDDESDDDEFLLLALLLLFLLVMLSQA